MRNVKNEVAKSKTLTALSIVLAIVLLIALGILLCSFYIEDKGNGLIRLIPVIIPAVFFACLIIGAVRFLKKIPQSGDSQDK